MMSRARSFGSRTQYAQAQALKTPSCDALYKLGVSGRYQENSAAFGSLSVVSIAKKYISVFLYIEDALTNGKILARWSVHQFVKFLKTSSNCLASRFSHSFLLNVTYQLYTLISDLYGLVIN